MAVVPWVCRSCIRALARPARPIVPIATKRSPTIPAPTVPGFLRRASTSTPTLGGGLPDVLLQRAERLHKEHQDIKRDLENPDTEYNADKAKQLSSLHNIATLLEEWKDGVASLKSLSELERSEDKELRDMAKMDYAQTELELEQLADQLTATLTPKHAFAHLPCVIEIRPGPGGQEGRLFADSLFRMYRQYCDRKRYQWRIVKLERAEGMTNAEHQEEQIQEAIIEVLDEGAYDNFRVESGMHRVQRVPATESKGRTHTSAVAVWVIPSFPAHTNEQDFENPESDFYITPTDVRTEKMRASGAGGQHVNKTESAIRLTHIPTGLVVSMQESRSQHQNRETAWRLLRSRVAQIRREEREEQAESLRSSVLGKDKLGRGDKIRTYNYSQNRCSDHRSGLDVFNLPDVMAGGDYLEKLIESAKKWMVQREVRMLIEDEKNVAPDEKKGKK
ncbi:uncharacterized protein MKZ38_005182 [Zalerion maritima]|uniref:Prokaryotic-type class I peptide chain release factors domain-containing protein n=1 Tax=Zalerion maritima TaxID=339359 RepID=A0AAD5WX90_9PEZI|nr:uncharacterized protein MKZ38_005182 [Zalerion maritima]